MDDYVADIDLVINELGLENPILIGHSLAGLLVLMHEKEFNKASKIISIDPSPSLEIQGVGNEEDIKKIPLVYNAMEAGMPADPMEAMKVLPDISKEKPKEGVIMAVGPGEILDSGERAKPQLSVGDTVIFSSYAGTDVKQYGVDYIIMAEEDILAIVE